MTPTTSELGSFAAGQPLDQGVRVKKDASGQLVPAGLTEKGVGFTVTPIESAGSLVGVHFLAGSPGTCLLKANGVVNDGDTVYTSADGLASSVRVPTSFAIGVAMSGAADGGLFEAQIIPAWRPETT